MKVKNIVSMIVLSMVVLMTACDGMNDLHVGYLEEGERIYAAKVDSVSPGAGKLRVNMEVFIKSQRINKLRIYWNSYQDSLDYMINENKGVFNIMVENLPEREYLFQIVSFDKYGNHSLPVEVTSRTYGESYRSTLSNRIISSLKKGEHGEALFSWAPAADDAQYTVLQYTDNKNNLQIREIDAALSQDTISDYLPTSSFSYYTVYRPASNSPDTFDTDKETGAMPE
ncbi:hypothetical protein DXD68_09310 [Parabacteroides sp. TM07-1AC]|jgi:hypothetical protein|uniref:DUF4998 domain-containing protein n=1 Tax=Parabacteroides sp. TM07-1AC TaxID=2292363 RepID=UPI000F0094DE|nr:DUF4998 domain-containing protein [Parabacteroides sp. TM07-1AC]RHU28091.1 hypothetical protein DXD68_09310 [Parabacteroides sp. TM07-1AC]